MLKTNDVLCIPINVRIVASHGHRDTVYYLCQCSQTPLGVVPNGAPFFLVSEYVLNHNNKLSKKDKDIPDAILRWGLEMIEQLESASNNSEMSDDTDE